jgi:hypothetical protein
MPDADARWRSGCQAEVEVLTVEISQLPSVMGRTALQQT